MAESAQSVAQSKQPPAFAADNRCDNGAAAIGKRTISPIQWTPAKEDGGGGGDQRRTSRSRSPQQQEQQEQEQPQPLSSSPPPELPSNIRYLFRDARYFMIKSSNYENVSLAKAKGVWATPPPNENRLNTAYHESRSVFLIFSVKESGRFQGYARLAGPSEKSISRVNWVLPPGLSHRALSGTFRIDWICRQEIRFGKTGHLLNAWNEFKPVKIGRDGQEIEPKTGEALCRLFPVDPDCDLERLVDRSRSRRRTIVPPTAPTVAHPPYYQYQHHHHYQPQQPPQMLHYQPSVPPEALMPAVPPAPPAGGGASASMAAASSHHPPPAASSHHPTAASSHHPPAAASASSSSSRRRRRSSGGGGARSSNRRSRSPPSSSAAAGGGAGGAGFQGVGKETFINGSYQDYLRQFGSVAVQQQPDQQHQQIQPQQLHQQYQQQYPGYGYQYPADPYAAAMMYSQQYVMPGQHPMYDYQQYQLQQQQHQQQQQQLQQQQVAQPLSAKEYEQRVNDFLQRTSAAPSSAAAGGGDAGGAGSSTSSDESSEHGGRRRHRRASPRR